MKTSHIAQVQYHLNEVLPSEVGRIAKLLGTLWEGDHTLFVIGNGGSAATASHFAADLAKATMETGARPFRSMALTDSSPLLTAIPNDNTFEAVFSAQLDIHMRPGDGLLVLTTSGVSPNICRALSMSVTKLDPSRTAGLLGRNGGRAFRLVAHPVVVGSWDPAVVEDIHSIICHSLVKAMCERVA